MSAASFPGIRRSSRSSGGRRTHAWCCFPRNSMSREVCARRCATGRTPRAWTRRSGPPSGPARRRARSGAETWLNARDDRTRTRSCTCSDSAHSIETYHGERSGRRSVWHSAWAEFSSANRCSAESATPRRWRSPDWSRSASRATSRLIDCQVASAHLASLGAREISRSEFAALLRRYARRMPCGSWAQARAVKLHYQGALCTMRAASRTP